MQFDYVTR